MKCFVGGYIGAKERPHGGTQYVRNLLENPPEGVEYLLPKSKVSWLNTGYYQFLRRYKTVDVSEAPYNPNLPKISKHLRWRTPELRTLKIQEEVDLIFYNQGFFLSNQPYVSSIEGDYVITNRTEYSPFKEVNMNTSLAKLYQRIILRRILLKENLKKILFWSNKALTESMKLFPEIKDKSCVLYPSVELPEPGGKKEVERVRLLFVGGDWIRKGFLLLAGVFAELRKKYDVELSVVTEKTFSVAEPGEDLRVYYNLPYEQVFPRVYLNSDVFVLPTRFETFGYSVLEAMACGLPVVTSDVYAMPEIVEDGKTGYLTPYGDMKALEEKLASLIEDASLRKRMGRAGRKRVEEKFSVPVFKEKVAGVYEESLRT